MKKLLKAPIGVQLSALFLTMLLVLFVVTAPWQLLAVFFGILVTYVAVAAVAIWCQDNL